MSLDIFVATLSGAICEFAYCMDIRHSRRSRSSVGRTPTNLPE